MAIHAAVGEIQHAFTVKAQAEQQEAKTKNQKTGPGRSEDDVRLHRGFVSARTDRALTARQISTITTWTTSNPQNRPG